jgi:hypothetical protein
LIEAYRVFDDLDTYHPDIESHPSMRILALHTLVADHRKTCPLCIEIDAAMKSAASNTLHPLER